MTSSSSTLDLIVWVRRAVQCYLLLEKRSYFCYINWKNISSHFPIISEHTGMDMSTDIVALLVKGLYTVFSSHFHSQ
ncbi:hypothetical protein GDO78_013060 [Eleutherodactylus coqui]|uniref:Uncharacterized protein n=1 Tax=Eleutherodactylus coqui TaxID=57060 RepID=A0A8J6EZW2_ELECQ|nr:hypothetical protein GDO78_013060 [Eleutherodactylus coqui]